MYCRPGEDARESLASRAVVRPRETERGTSVEGALQFCSPYGVKGVSSDASDRVESLRIKSKVGTAGTSVSTLSSPVSWS